MEKFFQLTEAFLIKYKNKKPNWTSLGELVYYRTYSRYIEKENKNETWYDTIKRVVEGVFNIQKEHCEKLRLPWKPYKAQKSAQIMYDKIFNFKFSPAGRGLWMMGTDFVKEKGGMPLINCAFVTTEDIDVRGSFPFIWTMDCSMLGVGVSFDIKGANKIIIKEPKETDGLIYDIPDTREGWVKSVEMLIDAYFYGKQIPKYNYNLIRKAGSLIKGFGGISSGSEPLKELHKNINKLLSSKIGDYLISVDIVDLMNFIGVCIVSGNVRRSAQLALGDYKDTEYMTMKNPRKYEKELKDRRWVSNNSVFVKVGETDYYNVTQHTQENGEPGFVWLDNIHKYGRLIDSPDFRDRKVKGLNPCGEIILESAEMCNLAESYPSHHKNLEEFLETLKYAYLYAKTVTLIPTHYEETNQVMMKNRRVGTSQSGIIDAFFKHGRRTMLDWCDKGYKKLREYDEIYSDWLCIPRSIRITTVKPSGTVALLANVSPGIHYPHDEYYIRRIRLASNSPLVEILKKANYSLEYSKYGTTEEDKKRTIIVSFPMHQDFFRKKKEDVSIWEQMKNAIDYQRFWSDNSVSCTVTFKPEEAKDIPATLEAYEDNLKAISFLPLKHEYEQPPYESITKEQYDELIKNLKPLDFSNYTGLPKGEKFCNTDTCEI